mmetsp:Transcript_19714/g.47323  ORF Transcript_19714/g.47323 Transcript_19714/m.47323 type:complete len:129 (-) Transcript_19714:500-886(-)
MRPSLFLAPSLTLSSRIRSGLCIIRARRPASSSRLHATTTTTTTTRRTGDGDNTIIVSPEGDDDDPSSLTSHSASVILCHGLGDTAEGWTEPARVRKRDMARVYISRKIHPRYYYFFLLLFLIIMCVL